MIVAAPGRTKLHVGTILDKRTLTKAQRADMGLPKRRNGTKYGPRGSFDHHALNFQRPAPVFSTSAGDRLEQQLREMFNGWPEWVRHMNSHRIV